MHHLIDLCVGLFAVSSVTIIWVRGEPFAPLKEALIEHAGKYDLWVAYLVSCAMCSGVWVGLGSYLFIQPELLDKPWWIELPLWAAMTGVTAAIIDKKIWAKSAFIEPKPTLSNPADEKLRG